MAEGRHRLDPEVQEMQTLVREYDGLIQQFRMERLGERLGVSGPRSVSHCDVGFSGDRLTLMLDGGAVLRLKLYWPVRIGIGAIRSVCWHENDGWVITAVSVAGDALVLRAWSAAVTF